MSSVLLASPSRSDSSLSPSRHVIQPRVSSLLQRPANNPSTASLSSKTVASSGGLSSKSVVSMSLLSMSPNNYSSNCSSESKSAIKTHTVSNTTPLFPCGWKLEDPLHHVQLLHRVFQTSPSCRPAQVPVNPNKRKAPPRAPKRHVPRRKSARLANKHSLDNLSDYEDEQDEYLDPPPPQLKFEPCHRSSTPGRSVFRTQEQESDSTPTKSAQYYNGLYSPEKFKVFFSNRDIMHSPVGKYALKRPASKSIRWSEVLEW